MKPQSLTLAAAVTVVAVLAGLALAEIVYLADGRSVQGKVTRTDGKVIVETPRGPKEFDAADVLYIAKVADDSRPVETAALPAELLLAPLSGRRNFAIGRAGRPEPAIFHLMRKVATAGGSRAGIDLQSQVLRWRIAAHDKRRNTGRGKWTAPAEFGRRRQIYETQVAEAAELLAEAEKINKRARRPGQAISVADFRKRQQLQLRGWNMLSQAAGTWPDPLGRRFLKGLAAYGSSDFRQAEILLAQCVSNAPYVAAFNQAHGMVLLQLNRPLDALVPLARALQLAPADTSYSLLRMAIEQTPGSHVQTDQYLAAARAVRDYTSAGRAKRYLAYGAQGFEWLVPGKHVRAEPNSLPILAHDRLDFRQAIAVPVGPSTLLVDEKLLAGALEIYVRIDADTIVPAVAGRRVSSSSRRGPAPPLALLTVKQYRFSPLELAEASACQAEKRVNAYGLDFYFEMGERARAFAARLEPAGQEQGWRLSTGLLPGEAAGPVVSESGQLVGFLAARTDETAEGGGPELLIPADELASLIKRARRPNIAPAGSVPKLGQVAAREVAGKFFIVHAISGEILP